MLTQAIYKRLGLELSQLIVAKRSGVGTRTISRIETGGYDDKCKNLFKIFS